MFLPAWLPPSTLPVSPREAEPQFHFPTVAPTISDPEDFQYHVTTTEFTEEAILMKVQVSRPPSLGRPCGKSHCQGRMGKEENEVGEFLLWLSGNEPDKNP